MVCQSFAPNPFKKDMCMTCQKNKALHPGKAPPTDTLSTPCTGPPCSHFTPNPFKKDICSTCQQPQALHVIPSKDCRESNVPISTQSRQNTRSCGEYKKHAFKDNICAHCGCSFDSHYTALATKTQRHDCNDNIVFKQTYSSMDEKNHFSSFDVVTEGCKDFREHAFKRNICVNCGKTKDDHNWVTGPQFGSRSSAVDKVKAEGKEIKPILQVSGSVAACSENERDANRTQPNKAEQSETNKYQVSEKKCDHDVNTNDCSDFREHAFKRNICVNCGKTKDDHNWVTGPQFGTRSSAVDKVKAEVKEIKPILQVSGSVAACSENERDANRTQPNKAEQSETNKYQVSEKKCDHDVNTNDCSDFREHAFKRNICVNCGKTKDDHNRVTGPQFGTRSSAVDKVKAEVKEIKPILQVSGSVAACSENERDANRTQPNKAEQSETNKYQVSEKKCDHDVNTNDCSDFREHAFKRNICVNCGKTKDCHTTTNNISERFHSNCHTLTNPLVRVPVKALSSKRTLENESSESEDAAPSTKPLVRVPVKAPSSKRTLENESSDSEDAAPSTKPLVRVPVKAPSPKRTLENESSESEDAAPSTKPLVRVPVKAPSSKRTLENESSDSEDAAPSTKPLVRVPVKALSSKRTLENESSDSEDAAPSTKPLVRVPVKAPSSKRTLENESSESEDAAPSTKPLVRVPVKAPSSKRTFENESSESGDGA